MSELVPANKTPRFQSVPDITYDQTTGSLLYQWLGSFWTGICEDSDLLAAMFKANGILSAELYQAFLDALNLSNRRKVPLYQRKPWYPIYLYLKDKNSSEAAGLKIGASPAPVLGPQTNVVFDAGSLCLVGGSLPYASITAYKLPANIVSIAAITDNITHPTRIYLHGVNFVIKDSTLYFLDGQDPFDNFPKTEEVEIDDETTTKVVLWCAETMVDISYPYNHAGYVLGMKDTTSEEYLKSVNALWDVYNEGATIAGVKSFISAILGEPFVISDREWVEAIVDTQDVKQVITDKNVYVIGSLADIRDDIVKGAELNRGDFITSTVRFYDNLDPRRLAADNPDAAQFKTDIPALFLPATFFRAELEHGVGVSWESVAITNQGEDSNGNPQYQFNVYGSDDDITSLWEDIWEYCEANGINGSDIFEGYIHAAENTAVGSIAGLISPLEFFMDSLLKANAFCVVVDVRKLGEYGSRNLYRLRELKKVIPAHTYMFVVQRINDMVSNYELENNYEETIIEGVSNNISVIARPGNSSISTLTYRDRILKLKWIPTCK